MSIFKKIASAFSSVGRPSGNAYFIYVRSHRCKENLSTRISLSNDLSEKDEGGYISRKVLATDGKNRCFDRVEVVLHFDEKKNMIDREISGGAFITAEEFDTTE